MPEYRAYMVGAEGNFVGYKPMICADDGEAIGKAKRLAGQYPVELWTGPRLVSSLPSNRPKPSPTRYTKAASFRNPQRSRP
jgi:hypothetical protein